MLKFVILQLDYSYLHVACAIFSLTSLAKEYSEHHTYELNGKSDIPSCQNVVSGFFYYLAIILLRLPSLMLLLLLFRYICFKIYILSSFKLFLQAKVCSLSIFLGTGFSCMPPCLCCSMEFWLFWLFVRHSVKLHGVPIHLFLLQRASFPDIR